MSEGLRVGNNTVKGKAITPEVGQVLQNCGKHLHTWILEARPPFGAVLQSLYYQCDGGMENPLGLLAFGMTIAYIQIGRTSPRGVNSEEA
jgi:hypothetical protein